MQKKTIVLMMVVVSMFLYSHAFSNDYLYRDICPSGGESIDDFTNWFCGDIGCFYKDRWNFVQCNCTSYVAHKLNEDGVLFDNSYQGETWSHGGKWGGAAIRSGILVDANPRVGDVAYWTASNIGGVGHVAYVEKVNGDGTIDISEYNWANSLNYGNRFSVPISSISGFIHFKVETNKVAYIEVADEGIAVYWTPIDASCANANAWCYDGTCSKDHTNSVCWEAWNRLQSIQPYKYLNGSDWYDTFFGNDAEYASAQNCPAN